MIFNFMNFSLCFYRDIQQSCIQCLNKGLLAAIRNSEKIGLLQF